MKKSYLIGGLVLVTGVGLFSYTLINQKPTVMEEKKAEIAVIPSDDSMKKDADVPATNNMMVEARYQTYSAENYAKASTKRRVLFFHAAWCPTCKAAHMDLEQNASNLPDDVIVFKVDYDTELELKKKYDITYQHTFVQVSEAGEELVKWNGGDSVMIRQKIQEKMYGTG